MMGDDEVNVRDWRPDHGHAPGFSPGKIGAVVVIGGCLVLAYLFLPLDRWFSGIWEGFGTTSAPPPAMATTKTPDESMEKLAQHYLPKPPPTPRLATAAPAPVATAEDTSALDALTSAYDHLSGQYAQLMDAFNQMKNQAPQPSGTPRATGMDDEAKKRADALKQKREAFAKSEPIFLTREKKDAIGQLHALKSPYSLAPSEVIPCTTTGTISSDTPGAFVAIVSHDVPDTRTRRHNVIPKGSKFVLKPRRSTIMGDSRIDVQAQTLTFPGGSWLKMPSSTVTDQYGTAGFTGQVDRHLLRNYGAVILTGVLRGGSTIVAGGYGGSPAERVSGAVAQDAANEATREARQMIRTDPTITVEALYSCQLLLEDELVLTRAFPWTPQQEASR